MKSNLIGAVTKLLILFLFIPQLSVAQNEDSTLVDTLATTDSLAIDEYIPESPFNSYFEPLSEDEVQRVKEGWNTNGIFENYKDIPDPKDIDGGYVSDAHNILQKDGIDTLNRIMRMLEDEMGAQFAVVCVNSIGSNDQHMYATDLFNYWGIGASHSNNGLLILLVLDVRQVSIITGYGMESVITDLETAEVRDEEMIPFFKKDDYTTGIIRGVQVFTEMNYGVDPYYLQFDDYDYDDYSSDDYAYDDHDSGPPTPFFERPFVRLYLSVATIAAVAWLIVFLFALLTVKDLHKRYHTMKFFTLLWFPIVFPVPFLLLYFLNKSFMKKWRDTERFSHQSGEYMIKLDESADDEFLKKGQIAEEVINSIDYDVWVTPDRSEVLILAYKNWFSKYRRCPKCKYKTWYKKYDKVIKSATYSSSGTGQRKYACKSCNHSKTTTYTIPKKTQSSSSSGGYSSGGSSFGGGSSYSGGGSSYSGGGGSSWGGGSSGGGGSTGGW